MSSPLVDFEIAFAHDGTVQAARSVRTAVERTGSNPWRGWANHVAALTCDLTKLVAHTKGSTALPRAPRIRCESVLRRLLQLGRWPLGCILLDSAVHAIGKDELVRCLEFWTEVAVGAWTSDCSS